MNTLVLIEEAVYVFPNWEDGGQCSGKTRRGVRCRNFATDPDYRGQNAGYVSRYYVEGKLRLYGPLTGVVASRYLAQRCMVHDVPDSVAHCPPEWARFDPSRDGHHLSPLPSSTREWVDVELDPGQLSSVDMLMKDEPQHPPRFPQRGS